MSAADQLDHALDRKRWSSLVARAALLGHQLWRTDAADGPTRFIVARWGMVRVLPDAESVDAWLDQVEGKREEPTR